MAELLARHLLATIAYRFQAVAAGIPDDFPEFRAGAGVRTPQAVLAHCVLVLRLARRAFDPKYEGPATAGMGWSELTAALHEELSGLDAHLRRKDPPRDWNLQTMVQGPLADVLTHIGQLAMQRRLAGSPVPGQSYVRARIEVGRVGTDQAPPESPLV